jgi:hypothetical protein
VLHVVSRSPGRTPAHAGTLAAVAATACALLGSPAGADVTKRPLKPTLAAAAGKHDAATGPLRSRTAAASGADSEARLVSFATRDMDIRKLDAAAFGDGDDVVR